jgi:hypothetical protein
MLAWARVVGLAAVLVVVLTYPTVPGFATMGRLDTGDGRFSIWNVGWIDHALTTSPAHVLDANIFYPHTGTLAYSELNLVAGALGLPVFIVTKNALAAHNSAVVIGLGLAFVCMWALVRRLAGSDEAGWVAATAFTFCPFVQSHTPHIQLLMSFGIPLSFLALDRLRETPSIRRAVELGAAVTVMGLSCAYYGIYGGAALAVAAIVFAKRERRYWIALAVAMVVTALLTAPVLVPYVRARAASGAADVTVRPGDRGYSAELRDYATSPARAHAWLNQNGPDSTFPGVIALGLAVTAVVVGVRRGDRRTKRLVWGYLAIAALAFWASFGPDAGLYRLVSIIPGASLLRAPVASASS